MNNITTEFINAVKDMKLFKYYDTHYWILDKEDNENYWAIVLGWSDGFEADEADDYTNGTYRLCAKLAYQPCNSIMQCDYDIDWLMPCGHDEEADNTEISIYQNTKLEEVVDWLLKRYESYNN